MIIYPGLLELPVETCMSRYDTNRRSMKLRTIIFRGQQELDPSLYLVYLEAELRWPDGICDFDEVAVAQRYSFASYNLTRVRQARSHDRIARDHRVLRLSVALPYRIAHTHRFGIIHNI
jgi:hypothetical protein